ncbi:hypothetical protein BD289DRAFT_483419 [Coniella lustricola]|uniref:Azaphilone pigments biosynthesis cluster protein L N-terminal domain-containing protein n=1 Tax=Coniella lustricola TaxID=2025994 RepID=A0A2T3A5I2_9PEZI|nr:hypothetical protein BD289DRAFT_483419 [Coniella lustricola]
MDPLSITASAIAVIQAAGFTTTTVYKFVQSIRTADSRVAALCSELSSLQSYLNSVQNILNECRSRKLAPLQPDLWQRCDESLKDCIVTLSLLEALVNKIKESAPIKGQGLRWRARVVVDLSIHGDELAEFRERIQKSNMALQTMLHTITLFLSLKNDASQDKIIFELEQLKCSFQAALQASLRSERADRSDARISHNLHNLATAARHFHSAASSTSEASKSSSRDVGSLHALSLMGDFPEHKRLRVEAFVKDGALSSTEFVEYHQEPLPVPTSPISFDAERLAPPIVAMPLEPLLQQPPKHTVEDEDDEEEYEREYFDGLRDLARDRIVHGAYEKAIQFLNEAATHYADVDPACTELRNIQAQLALCHFFQSNWKMAEPIVKSLSSVVDEVSCNLLHALALAHLSEYSFDAALDTCRKAVFGKKRLLKHAPAECTDYAQYDSAITLALYANIHHMTGDPIRAEIFHKRLPRGFIYEHPSSELDFIVKHPRFLGLVLGNDVPTFLKALWNNQSRGRNGHKEPTQAKDHPTVMRSNRDGDFAPSPLRTRFADFTRYEDDTCKIVVAGPECCSPVDSAIDMTFSEDVSPIDDAEKRSDLTLIGDESPSKKSSSDHTLRRSLRRRITRTAAAKQRPKCPESSRGVSSTPTAGDTAVTPSSRWPRLGSYFGIVKSNGSRPKESDNALAEITVATIGPKRCMSKKLRNMVVTTRNTTNIKQASQWLRGKGCNEASNVVWPSNDASRFMGWSGAAAKSLDDCTTSECQQSANFPHSITISGTANSINNSRIVPDVLTSDSTTEEMSEKHCELADTECGFKLSDTCPNPVGILDEWETLHGWHSSALPDPLALESMTVVEEHKDTGDMDEAHTNQSSSPCSQNSPATANNDHSGHITEQIPARLAAILMLLPDASESKKQAVIKPKLKALLRDVELFLHDPMLAQDLRTIIASIGDRPAHHKTAQHRERKRPQRELSLFDQELDMLLNASAPRLPPKGMTALSKPETPILQTPNENIVVAVSPTAVTAGDKHHPAPMKQISSLKVVEDHCLPIRPLEERVCQPLAAHPRPTLSLQSLDQSLGYIPEKQTHEERSHIATISLSDTKQTEAAKPSLRPTFSFRAGDDARFWSGVKAIRLGDEAAAQSET